MGKNTDPSPMDHVSIRLPNRNMERARLAREAEGLSATELRSRAAEVGIDTGGARSKSDLVEAVQTAVTPE